MTYQVFQHWDPLQVCVVGMTYPPDYYHWIQDRNTRQRFQTLAEETEADYIASVEFTGVIQETVGEQAEPFEEVWNMTKSKSQGGWLLAGIQTRE